MEPGGGHSLIEPLSYGLPVLHGRFVENIEHVSKKAHSRGLAFQVRISEDIEKELNTLLDDDNHRIELAEKAKTFILDHQGASKKMAEVISKYIKNNKNNLPSS